MHSQFPDRLPELLRVLDRLPYAGRLDALMAEVTETGGIWRVPQGLPPAARFYCELHLHGITGVGADEPAMITDWIATAKNSLPESEAA